MYTEEKSRTVYYKKILIDGKLCFPGVIKGIERGQATKLWENFYLNQIDIFAIGFEKKLENAIGKRILLVYNNETPAYGYSYKISQIKIENPLIIFIVDPSSIAAHLSDNSMLG